MKQQLSPIFRFFYSVPAGLNLFAWLLTSALFWVLVNSNRGLSFVMMFASFCFLIMLFGKAIADEKIQKLRTGINPLYLSRQFPNNLEEQVKNLLSDRYELKEKTATTARLEKRPRFSVIIALFLFSFGIIPGIIYVIWFAVQKNEMVYLDLSTQHNA